MEINYSIFSPHDFSSFPSPLSICLLYYTQPSLVSSLHVPPLSFSRLVLKRRSGLVLFRACVVNPFWTVSDGLAPICQSGLGANLMADALARTLAKDGTPAPLEGYSLSQEKDFRRKSRGRLCGQRDSSDGNKEH